MATSQELNYVNPAQLRTSSGYWLCGYGLLQNVFADLRTPAFPASAYWALWVPGIHSSQGVLRVSLSHFIVLTFS